MRQSNFIAHCHYVIIVVHHGLNICHQASIIHSAVWSGGKLELILSEYTDPQLSHGEAPEHLNISLAIFIYFFYFWAGPYFLISIHLPDWFWPKSHQLLYYGATYVLFVWVQPSKGLLKCWQTPNILKSPPKPTLWLLQNDLGTCCGEEFQIILFAGHMRNTTELYKPHRAGWEISFFVFAADLNVLNFNRSHDVRCPNQFSMEDDVSAAKDLKRELDTELRTYDAEVVS